jgi:hypothetical protein
LRATRAISVFRREAMFGMDGLCSGVVKQSDR